MFSRCFNPIFIVDIKLGSLFLQEVAAFQDTEVNFFSEVTVANGTTLTRCSHFSYHCHQNTEQKFYRKLWML